jgi:signal transduction histidine kinase
LLYEFLQANRAEILAQARQRVASRNQTEPASLELETGLPIFLDQLADALRLKDQTGTENQGPIVKSASRHGKTLWREGFTIRQVVQDYGDICQVVTALAVERNAPVTTEEFRTLNLCLDDATAEAVTAYARHSEGSIRAEGTERLGVLVHEMRSLLNTAILSFESIKSGVVALNGSTGLMHGRSLLGLRNLIDRSFADVRIDSGLQHLERVAVAEVIEEVEISGSVQAQARGIHLTVKLGEPTVIVEADRQILTAAVANLVQNALKFTRKKGKVWLTTSTSSERVLIEVEDECGGLPPGKAEELFMPYSQRGGDRTGLGLGLSICLKAAKAMNGELRVRDMPGKGCVFTIDLPKQPPPPTPIGTRQEKASSPTSPSSAVAPEKTSSRTRSGSN